MKLFKKKEGEEKVKQAAQKANEKWDKLQHEIDELNKYQTMFCPFTSLSFSFDSRDSNIHNNLLYRAIRERIEKLKKEQKEIEI